MSNLLGIWAGFEKTNRHVDDVPLAQASDKLWNEMPERIGQSVGYKQSGILFLAKNR